MKMLKYTMRTVVQEQDMDGNPVEREIFTTAYVPADEKGRALAEKEAYDGVITSFDGGEDIDTPTTEIETRVSNLEHASAEMTETIEMILLGVTGDE